MGTLGGARTETHVHIVVDGECVPEIMLDDFKQYANRALNSAGVDKLGRKRWTRHGSTKMLRDRESRERAIRYIVEKQGGPMAVYVVAGQRAP